MRKAVTQRTISKISSDKDTLNDIVKEQINVIEDRIIEAAKCGQNKISYQLPLTFNTDIPDAWVYVVSELIEIYSLPESKGGREFRDVYITKNGKDKYLVIGWGSIMGRSEKKRREELIYGATK